MKRFSIFTLLLMLGCLAWAADSPKTVLAESGSGRVIYPTNFWTGNSTSINAVVTNRIPSGGTSGQSLVKASDTNYDVTWSTITGGEGGGAPTTASYLVLGADGTLTSERVLTPGTGLSYSDAGAGGAYTVSVTYGTTAGTAAQGNDSRLSDARTPTAHTHGLSDITDEGTAASRNTPATGNASATEVVLGSDTRLSDARTPVSHTHGLADVTDEGTAASRNVPASGNASSTEVVLGSDTRLSDARTPSSHTHGLADITDEGTAASHNVPASGNAAATEVVLGSDTRLSDARTPTTHAHSESDVTGLATDLAAKASIVTTTRGDLIKRGASADQRLALGGVKGGFLASDGTDPFWMDPTMGFVIFSDFVCYTASASSFAMAPWVGTVANSASVGTRGGTGAHPGIISLETGSNAAGAAAVNMGNPSNGAFKFGSGLLYCRFLSKINTVVSDATDTFTIRIGVGNATTAQPTDGAYFQYTHSINEGNWCLVNRKSSTDYGTNAMTLAVSGTWTLFEITVAADASSITFSTTPEGGSKTTTTYTEAANITTAEVSPFMHIIKSAGTTGRTLHTDYTLIYYRLTTARQ